MIKLNIGGKIFVTTKDTLTRWGVNKFSEDLEWNRELGCLFYDRDPLYADLIINHLRGYTITFPPDKKELYMLYEDAKYFKIKSLEEQLHICIFPPKQIMTPEQRKEIIDWICKKIHELKMENLKSSLVYIDRLTDDELGQLKSKVVIYEKECESTKMQESVFQVCLVGLRWFEKKFSEGCTSRFMKDQTLFKKLIKDVVDTHQNSLLRLVICLTNTIFEKKIGY